MNSIAGFDLDVFFVLGLFGGLGDIERISVGDFCNVDELKGDVQLS